MTNPHVYWIVAAIVLVIIELLTGTFYLLVLGVAAAGGAALAYFGFGFPLQAGVASVVAVIGVLAVNRYRATLKSAPGASNSMDIGQRVTIDSWINESEGLARVRYRDALWDARVVGTRRDATSYYIRSIDGNTLTVEAQS